MANEQNLKPFKPGQSGNPAGRPVGARSVKSILRDLVDLPVPVKGDDGATHTITRLEGMLAQLVKQAGDGDLASLDRVLDRLEGKPETTNKTVGDPERPVHTQLSVDPDTLAEAMDKFHKKKL